MNPDNSKRELDNSNEIYYDNNNILNFRTATTIPINLRSFFFFFFKLPINCKIV